MDRNKSCRADDPLSCNLSSPVAVGNVSALFGFFKLGWLATFPSINAKIGPVRSLKIGMTCMIAALVAIMVSSAFSSYGGVDSIHHFSQGTLVVLAQLMVSASDCFGYMSVFILLTNAANRASETNGKMATVHGIASACSCIGRMGAPFLAATVFGWAGSGLWVSLIFLSLSALFISKKLSVENPV